MLENPISLALANVKRVATTWVNQSIDVPAKLVNNLFREKLR